MSPLLTFFIAISSHFAHVQAFMNAHPKPTFLISGGSGLDHAPMRRHYEANGWAEVSMSEALDLSHRFVDYLCLEQLNARFDKESYKIRSFVKNIISNEKKAVTDKEKLFNNMMWMFPEIAKVHMARSQPLKNLGSVARGETLIVKPVGDTACGGKDIFIVTDNAGLDRAQRALRRYPSAVACDYIDNPLLWEGRKFHLRMYLLIVAGPVVSFSYDFWGRGKVLTAAKPYTPGRNFGDKGIHDTHADSTPRNLWFPEDYPLGKERAAVVLEKMKKIASAVAEVMRGKAKPYDESDNAFEVFGCDFLVTRDENVILLEVVSFFLSAIFIHHY
jgi:hypothetical protein